jgi:hypothetical protein
MLGDDGEDWSWRRTCPMWKRTLAGCRIALLVALALSPTLVLGCGGSGHYLASGAIEVYNSPFSFEAVNEIRLRESPGGALLFFNVFIVPGDSFVIGGLAPTTYDVSINWTDGVRDDFFGVDVFSGSSTPLHVQN